MIDDEALDARLTSIDRASSLHGTDDGLDALLHDVSSSARRRPRRLKLVSAFAVGALIVVGAGALPAAAAIQSFLAQFVEDPPPGGGTETIPDSDWIDVEAADIDDFVASQYPDSLPLPDGVDQEAVISTVSFSITRLGGIRQEIGVDLAYEAYIYCRWVDVWLESDARGDAVDREYAAKIMTEATAWPALVASDGGGVVDQQKRFAAAATNGDRTEVQAAFDANACPDWKAMGSTE
jgi:hypothetical protein